MISLLAQLQSRDSREIAAINASQMKLVKLMRTDVNAGKPRRRK
jgi:hypothetical protein